MPTKHKCPKNKICPKGNSIAHLAKVFCTPQKDICQNCIKTGKDKCKKEV